MVKDYEIRPEKIIDYLDESKKQNRKGWEILHERNDLHRKLNEKYGLSDPDGLVTSAYYPCDDPAYHKRWYEINDKYKKPYENVDLERKAKRAAMKLTIFEYLLLDNIHGEEEIFEAAKKGRSDFELIGIKARCEFKQWVKDGQTIEEINILIRMEKGQFGWVSNRCKKDLKISKLNLKAVSSISNYKRTYFRYLEDFYKKSRLK